MGTGLFLLRQLLAYLDDPAVSNLTLHDPAYITPEILERLRETVLADTVHRGPGFAGISIGVDARQLMHHVQRMGDMRAARADCEHLLRAGASQRLLTRLFGVTQQEVRRLRQMLVPGATRGGRPRQPTEEQQLDVMAAWAQTANMPERQRYLELARRFPGFSLVALESVLAKAGAQP